jgi:hypothetical protein
MGFAQALLICTSYPVFDKRPGTTHRKVRPSLLKVVVVIVVVVSIVSVVDVLVVVLGVVVFPVVVLVLVVDVLVLVVVDVLKSPLLHSGTTSHLLPPKTRRLTCQAYSEHSGEYKPTYHAISSTVASTLIKRKAAGPLVELCMRIFVGGSQMYTGLSA